MAITETYLGTYTDQILLNELTPAGEKVYHTPRRGRKGGVALIARLNLKIVEEKQSCENV